MRVGLDIDGTVTAMPEVFRDLTASLTRYGSHVFIVTAALPTPQHRDKNTERGRQEELAEYGLFPGTHYDQIVLAWGADRHEVAREKARQCQRLHLDVMFDNDPLNVAACREVTNVLVPSDDPPVYR